MPTPTLFDAAIRAAVAPTAPFRIEASWPGGGFGYTMHFADKAEAHRWARNKAKYHRDAVITVSERPATRELNEQACVVVDREFAAARYSGSIQQAADDRALREQVAAQHRAEWSARS